MPWGITRFHASDAHGRVENEAPPPNLFVVRDPLEIVLHVQNQGSHIAADRAEDVLLLGRGRRASLCEQATPFTLSEVALEGEGSGKRTLAPGAPVGRH